MPTLSRYEGSQMPASVNRERLLKTIDDYARIGATDSGGVTRLALSEDDGRARERFAGDVTGAGLELSADDFGNMVARREGSEILAPIQIGSHLDTVRRGGRFDGALGVLGGLEVIRAFNDAGITTRHPVDLINWTNEEGVRFEPAMMGSGVACGVFDREWACDRTDRDGVRLGDELRRIGFQGERNNRPPTGAAYLELHIEQGPVLDDADIPVGIVEGIVGITWINVRILGQADHAGPSPMALRRDALAAAAEIILVVEHLASESGPPVVGTVGRFDLEPNIINTIPSQVEMSVDFRHRDAEGLKRLVDRLIESADEIETRRGVDIQLERFWTSPPTAFDARIVDAVALAADAVGAQSRRLWSGAGHDAKYAAEMTSTGMIFVRSRGGLSHCEQEFSESDDIIAGVATLLQTVVALDASLDPIIT